MRSIHDWLAEYNESHQNRLNKILHWICVPIIVLSILGLLWTVKTPSVFKLVPFTFNWAILIMLLAFFYYLLISPKLALGMLLVLICMAGVLSWLDNISIPLWLLSIIVFIIAWVGQFIGHFVEGKRPSFFKDIQFLMIGPLWLLSFVYRRLGISY